MRKKVFPRTVAALADTFTYGQTDRKKTEQANEFIQAQLHRMPDFVRFGFNILLLSFNLYSLLTSGRCFFQLSQPRRLRITKSWKRSNFGLAKDFLRFFESFASLVSNAPEKTPSDSPDPPTHVGVLDELPETLRCEILIVGSGPGASVTAATLAEAGREVVIIEEGPWISLDAIKQFSCEEMANKYRSGGIAAALGSPKINFVEGRCVGGGSEVNSGLYHRTPEEILHRWRREFEVRELQTCDLEEHFSICERDISVSRMPEAPPLASQKLALGATHLGWRSLEVPRWIKYDDQGRGRRQTMTETYLPRALAAGARIAPLRRAERLERSISHWNVWVRNQKNTRQVTKIQADAVFIAAGAIETPALLLRSGIRNNIGQSLQMHPTVKISASFPETVNSENLGVPVHQVKEFAPDISLGCSISSKEFLSVGLLEYPHTYKNLDHLWKHMASYYGMITPKGVGRISLIPGFRSPLIRYSLLREDIEKLKHAFRVLGEILLASGATRLYPSLDPGFSIESHGDLKRCIDAVSRRNLQLMTIHLFSSCPMGEDLNRCATDSFGRLHGFSNLYIADASLLCSAPGVNPQGSILAICRRNALHYLHNARSS